MIIRGCRYVVGSKTSRCRESANGVHKPSSVYKDQDLTDKIYLPLPQLIKIKASPRVVFFLMSQSNPVQSNPANWLHGSTARAAVTQRLSCSMHGSVHCIIQPLSAARAMEPIAGVGKRLSKARFVFCQLRRVPSYCGLFEVPFFGTREQNTYAFRIIAAV